MTGMTQGYERRVVDVMNSLRLWMTCATPSYELRALYSMKSSW